MRDHSEGATHILGEHHLFLLCTERSGVHAHDEIYISSVKIRTAQLVSEGRTAQCIEGLGTVKADRNPTVASPWAHACVASCLEGDMLLGNEHADALTVGCCSKDGVIYAASTKVRKLRP